MPSKFSTLFHTELSRSCTRISTFQNIHTHTNVSELVNEWMNVVHNVLAKLLRELSLLTVRAVWIGSTVALHRLDVPFTLAIVAILLCAFSFSPVFVELWPNLYKLYRNLFNLCFNTLLLHYAKNELICIFWIYLRNLFLKTPSARNEHIEYGTAINEKPFQIDMFYNIIICFLKLQYQNNFVPFF